MYKAKIKQEAISLRKMGYSYSFIQRKLTIPKSTLSTWMGNKFDVFNKQDQLDHLKKIRILASRARTKQKLDKLEIVKNNVLAEFNGFRIEDKRIGKLILAGLYWAEGSKHKGVSGLKFANIDPEFTKLYITLLRWCYPIDEDKFRVKLHIHHYHKDIDCKKFWSKTLRIPLNKFYKTYLKERSKTRKFRENFRGICFLSYLDSNIRRDLLEIGVQTIGLIEN